MPEEEGCGLWSMWLVWFCLIIVTEYSGRKDCLYDSLRQKSRGITNQIPFSGTSDGSCSGNTSLSVFLGGSGQ